MKKTEALQAGIYKLIFENMLEGIYLITSENGYLTANHALAADPGKNEIARYRRSYTLCR